MSCYSLVILEVWAPYLGFAGMSRGGAAVFYMVFGWNLLLPESVCLARMPLWLEKAAGRGGGIFWSVSVAVSGLRASLAPKSGMCQEKETQELSTMLYLGSRGPYLLAHLSESTYCLLHIMFRVFSCT